MPADRIAAVRARVGARGFSAHVSAAVERQLQRGLLEELLVENERQAGPIPRETHDRAARAFRAAEAPADHETGSPAVESGSAVEEDAWRDRRAG
ncbi:hypothetical protein SAMN05192584_107203 [Streptomyces pini]|uniref:Uncharacterized protein n=2 Tax=Streptomyces pini TaxID=1520580 RepID=A0A1I4B0Q9_9ACTN|nr:hypothetical protein SAMN05192584_107203 [Streptomyces pini]